MIYGVVIISYNRPHYLERVLKSIQQQTHKDYEIHLFNDGPYDPDVQKCHNIFEEYFPNGTLHKSLWNLGVCFNYKRAEEFMFDKYDRVIFMADDCTIVPFYFDWLHLMAEKFNGEKTISCISGWNDAPARPLVWQEKNKAILLGGGYMNMMMYKRAYEKWKPYMLDYYTLLKNMNTPYIHRNHEDIFKFYHGLGVKVYENAPGRRHGRVQYTIGSSQDAMKDISHIMAGLIRIKTGANYCSYIGEYGVHGRPDWFIKQGMDKEETYPELFTDIEYTKEDIMDIYTSNVDRYMRPDNPVYKMLLEGSLKDKRVESKNFMKNSLKYSK